MLFEHELTTKRQGAEGVVRLTDVKRAVEGARGVYESRIVALEEVGVVWFCQRGARGRNVSVRVALDNCVTASLDVRATTPTPECSHRPAKRTEVIDGQTIGRLNGRTGERTNEETKNIMKVELVAEARLERGVRGSIPLIKDR